MEEINEEITLLKQSYDLVKADLDRLREALLTSSETIKDLGEQLATVRLELKQRPQWVKAIREEVLAFENDGAIYYMRYGADLKLKDIGDKWRILLRLSQSERLEYLGESPSPALKP